MEEIPRISIDEIGVPIVRQLEPPVFVPPVIRNITKPVVEVPSADIPSYEPIDVPTQEEWEKVIEKQNTNEEEEEEVEDNPRQMPAPAIPQTPVINVPVIGEIPVPPKETVILSGTTATASVAAALVGKSLVERLVKIFKPIIKTTIGQIKKRMGRDLTPYETQLLFAMDLNKKVKKSLLKDQKEELMRQHDHWEELQQHLHKSSHTDSVDESEHQLS